MDAPVAPGPRLPAKTPLFIVCSMVGGLVCALALVATLLPSVVRQLASDALVMRALGITLGACGYMLVRVALRTTAGLRRSVTLVLSAPLMLLGLCLIGFPSLAPQTLMRLPHLLVPGLLGLEGALLFLHSRWRAYR